MTVEQFMITNLTVAVVYLFARNMANERRIKELALDQAAVEAAVAKIEDDLEKVVNAVADARKEIADLKQEVTDLSTVNDADTQKIVDRLTAVDNALDAAVPDTAPVP